MPIKFLTDYETKSLPPEVFTAGQIVEGRSEASELHFVTRGAAAYYDPKSKALSDHEGKPVADADEATSILVNVSNNRDGEVGRAGEVLLEDGTPQRASSGPGEVVTTTSVTEGESHKAPAKKAKGGK